MLAANIERYRVQEWIADLRIGGQGGFRLQFAGQGELKCHRPVDIFCRGLPDKLLVNLGVETETHRVATIETRCRKCQPCLTARSQLWAARARDELKFSPRTWFGTLTLAPANVMRATFAVQRRLTQQGHALADISEAKLFSGIVAEVGPELTRWLKRIRKNSGARLRYLLVCEKHKSGVPHWHILIHQPVGKVSKAQLEASWRYGFSHFRLVPPDDERTAFYVAKYLGKSAEARVRASVKYGAIQVASVAEQIEELVRAVEQGTASHRPLLTKGPLKMGRRKPSSSLF